MQISLVSYSSFQTLPRNPPKFFLLFVILFFSAGFCLSPQIIKELEIFDSLNDPNPMISSAAEMEFLFFQVVSFILALSSGAIYVFWSSIRSSKFVSFVMNLETLTEEESQMLWEFNFNILFSYLSFLTMATLYLKLGTKILPASIVELINREDGIIEWGTAILFLIAGVISLTMVPWFKGERARFLYLGIGVLFFLCFVEEISWGQRLLGLKSPGFSIKYNVQKELNIHNLGGYFFDHLFILGVFFYGYILPVLYRLHLFLYNLFNYLNIPIASLGLALGFLLVSVYHDWTVAYFIKEKWRVVPEIRELLTASLFVLLMLETRKRFSYKVSNQ